MEISKYILLFHKKLKGEIKPEEQKELAEWMSREEGAALARQLEKTWEAAGRYKEGYQPDTAGGLARFSERLSAAGQPPVLRPAGGRLFRLMAAAAVLALLVLAGWWALSGPEGKTDGILVYSTSGGQSLEVPLPDGSRIVLNENSLLTLSEDFRTASSRQVELSGEAYFEVAPDPNRPFAITTPATRVEVLGTAFNLRAYPHEPFTEAAVHEGKVRFSDRQSGKSMALSAGDRAICEHGRSVAGEPAPEENAHAWRTHRLEFRNTPLQLALPDIERYFKVELELENSQAANCALTMAFEQDSLDMVLKALQLIYHFEVKQISKGRYMLMKGGC